MNLSVSKFVVWLILLSKQIETKVISNVLK